MYRIHPAYLLWVLDGLRAGLIINHIKVSETVKRNANKAIKRMIAL
jgi:quinolinate synthase